MKFIQHKARFQAAYRQKLIEISDDLEELANKLLKALLESGNTNEVEALLHNSLDYEHYDLSILDLICSPRIKALKICVNSRVISYVDMLYNCNVVYGDYWRQDAHPMSIQSWHQFVGKFDKGTWFQYNMCRILFKLGRFCVKV
eukprot:TRINITY_DN6117_c0_g1_i1.p1 TRINITY_DN6117_c0_g1~~TRINITY_DN6117_c0_g1_i1.p1  ORF type:complete len:144 (+),score=13.96 TRINITY_DN6117_c0_g1_i1:253-684(+)